MLGMGLLKRVGTAVFGSPEKSLLSNTVKSAGLTAVTGGIGLAPIQKQNKLGKGFKMNSMNKTAGLANIIRPARIGLSTKLPSVKLAQPKSALGNIAPSTGGGANKSILSKTAAQGGTPSSPALKGMQTLGMMGLGALALKGADNIHDKYTKYKDKKRFDETISHAVRKNPELKKVPQSKLHELMNSFYTLAPHLAKDKGIASSMLATVNNYGGDIDLATAKMISEIGNKSKKDPSDKVTSGLKNSLAVVMA